MRTETKQETKHTPTPWMVNGYAIKQAKMGGKYIVIPTSQENDGNVILANAAFIVRAVNSHETLLETVKTLVKIIKENDGSVWATGQVMNAEKVIAQAEGK